MTGEVKKAHQSRPLPSDPKEWEAALLPYKAMAAPWIVAVDKTLGHFPPKEGLDKKETAGLETSVAAVLYQEGMQMNAWFLLGMTVMGIGSYRVIKYLDDKAREADAKKNTMSVSEMQAKLNAARQANAAPVANSSHAASNGVNGTRQEAGSNPVVESSSEVKKTITAEQAVAIIHFPGEKN